MWLYVFYSIVEDMNDWLSQEGEDGLKVKGESCGCICFILLLRT